MSYPTACPKCGSDDIQFNTQRMNATYPPQYIFRCLACLHQWSQQLELGWIPEWVRVDKPTDEQL